jgi:hypothetical protein
MSTEIILEERNMTLSAMQLIEYQGNNIYEKSTYTLTYAQTVAVALLRWCIYALRS